MGVTYILSSLRLGSINASDCVLNKNNEDYMDLTHKGYSDALDGKQPSSKEIEYLTGYRTGLNNKVEWAKLDLESFDADHYTSIVQHIKPTI